MGHKVHPFGFRLGYIRDWQTHWFADRAEQYRTNLQEDLQIRDHIIDKHRDAAVARVELERKASEVRALIHTARPGVVIGRGGQRVEELRQELENLTGKRVRVDINEIRQPELEATLVAQSIADQIQRQVSFRRATRQAVQRSMQAGAQGIRVSVSGRLGGQRLRVLRRRWTAASRSTRCGQILTSAPRRRGHRWGRSASRSGSIAAIL